MPQLAPNALPISDAAPKESSQGQQLPPGKTVTVADDDKIIKFNNEGFLGEVDVKDEEDDEEEQKLKAEAEAKEKAKTDDTTKDTTEQPKEDKEIVSAKTEEAKIANQPALQISPKQPVTSVDQEGFTEVEQRYLKQSSKESREFFAARLKSEKKALDDLKALQTENVNLKNTADGKLPQNYLEHPDAYIFSPKFKEAQGIMSRAKIESNHWEKQLEKIAEGKKFNLLDYNGETGEYSIGAEQEPSVGAERQISKLLRNGEFILNKQQEVLQGIVGEHKNQHSNYIKQFRSLEDQYFPHYSKDDKTEGKPGKHISTSRKLIGSLGQEHNPMAGLMTKLYAALMESEDHNKVISAELAKFKQLPDKKALGPNSGDINSGGSGKAGAETLVGSDDEKVSLSLFDKYRS
jgi:hypothetical protein